MLHYYNVPGTMSTREYDDTVADLVAYLQWMGEPSQGKRVRVGVGVLIFLGLLIVITWRLNAAYWKSVEYGFPAEKSSFEKSKLLLAVATSWKNELTVFW